MRRTANSHPTTDPGRWATVGRAVIAAALVVVAVPAFGTVHTATVSASVTADRVFYQRYSGSAATCPVGSQAQTYGCLGAANSFSSSTLYSSKPDGTDERPIEVNCTGVNAHWLAPFGGVEKIVVDAAKQKLYWENSSEPGIVRSNIDGSNCEYVAFGDYYGITSIAIDGTGDYLYSIRYSTIRRVNTTTGVVDSLTLSGLGITPNNSYSDLTVAGGKLYATLDNVGSAGHIVAVTLDTSSTTQAASLLVTAQPVGMKGISVDSTNGFVYWATGSQVKRAVLSNGSGIQTVRSGSFNYVVAMPAASRLVMGVRGNQVAVTTDLAGGSVATTSIRPNTYPTAGAVPVFAVAQNITWSPNTTVASSPAAPAAATTTGDGAISYAVASAGATGCTVNGSTAQLQYTSGGDCVVRATAAATALFLAASVDVTFHVSVPAPTTTVPTPPASDVQLSVELDAGEPFAGADVTISGDGLQPFSTLTIELHSTPIILGSTTTDAAGAFTITVRIPADVPPGAHTIVVSGTSTVGGAVSAEEAIVIDWAGKFVAGGVGSRYNAIAPHRVLDTRESATRLAAGEIVEIDVAASGRAPAGAAAVVANFTVTEPVGPGFVTVFPCGGGRPLASTVNYAAGQTISNMAVAAIGDNGKVCAFTSADSHLVVDVSGYFAATGDRFTGNTPARILDTRDGTRIHAGAVVELAVGGDGTTSAAAINVIAVDPSDSGFLTVFACGTDLPTASNVNFSAGHTASAHAFAQVVGGTVCLYSSASTDVVVDLSGVFSPAGTSAFVPVSPGRLLDTRDGAAAQSSTDRVIDFSMLPASTTAVALNVTVTNAAVGGYVTLYPCGQQVPVASSLNFAAGATVANHVTAQLSDARNVCVRASGQLDLVVDVTGLYSTSG